LYPPNAGFNIKFIIKFYGREKDMKLKIAYIGDTHGQLEGDRFTKLGHLSRVATVFEDLSKHNDLIRLHGGDILGQSPYSQCFKGCADMELFHQMKFHAYVVGNHDFNLGTQHLSELIQRANTPFLGANLNVAEDEYLAPLIKPFILHTIGDKKVAIIGLVTEEIIKYGVNKTGGVTLLDIGQCLDETLSLSREQGADEFIIVSHLGYKKDQELALSYFKTKKMSIVILGNHTHTTTGNNLPSGLFGEKQGAFPTILEFGDNHRALITTVPHHGQAVAFLEVEYDEQHHISSHSNDSTIIVDDKVPQNEMCKNIILNYKAKLPAELAEIYAQATIAYSGLDGQPPYAKPIEDYIRQTESPIGNLAADALYWQAKELNQAVDVALIHAGGIRADWNEGALSGWDIHQLHPFDHKIIILELSFFDIKQALEEAVYNEDFHRRSEFLIGSKGLKYSYNINEPRNWRIMSLSITKGPLNNSQFFRVAINGFMANAKTLEGHDGLFKRKLTEYKAQLRDDKYAEYPMIDREAVINYLRNNPEARILTGKLDGRIIYKGQSLLDIHAPAGIATENKYIACINALKFKAFLVKNPLENASSSELLQDEQEARSISI
jgi:2',3'-cyclic-nucleotide 2'-phosphodiesterase (5'-nucleotidase family)